MRVILFLAFAVCLPLAAADAAWQFRVAVPQPPGKDGKPRPEGEAVCWLPPQGGQLRGLLLCGQLGIEGELVVSTAVRAACAESGIGIVYLRPHLSGVFHFWKEGGADGARLLAALDALAAASARPELRRVPWITAGHSTAGIFSRNVAYWQPQRVAAVIHIKSGNFHQAEHLPPTGSLAGIPLVAVNGQLETFGPASGIDPELGRETQWIAAQRDLQAFRAKDGEHLVQMLVQPGDDHFHGAPELEAFVALFLRATAQHRLPEQLPPGDGPVPCRTVKVADGWLSDPDLRQPKHPAAPFAQYAGDRAQAMWHYDRAVAEATAAMHRNLAEHQCLENPVATWLDEGDGWSFRVAARWLDRLPEKFGGKLANREVGHAATPVVFRCKPTEPVVQVAPDVFRVLRPAKSVNIAAFHPGDERFRSTVRWGAVELPAVKGAAQTIAFPAPGDLAVGAPPRALAATSSAALPIRYEVDYGPVAIVDGALIATPLPPGTKLPLPCKVTAHQIGRRTAPAVQAAKPVSVELRVVGAR